MSFSSVEKTVVMLNLFTHPTGTGGCKDLLMDAKPDPKGACAEGARPNKKNP